MIDTFYEQIKTFGKLIKCDELIKDTLVGETYKYNDNKIRVYVKKENRYLLSFLYNLGWLA